MIRSVTLCALAALVVAGCGGGQSSSSVQFGHGDSATFAIDGRSISVTQSGRASVHIAGAPQLSYNGPVGCRGRYFTADFVDGVPMFFRYGSQDAYLLVGSDLYYLGGAPDRSSGKLSWNTTANGHQINIEVSCPPPPRTGPLTAAATPSACAVLTRATARSALGEKVGGPKFVQENPYLSYCTYTSLDKSSTGNRSVSLSVASAKELAQLISWQQPRIPGLGDETHGGQASDGLAVRKGSLGFELTVDLGFSADNAKDLGAEEAVARKLLTRLPG